MKNNILYEIKPKLELLKLKNIAKQECLNVWCNENNYEKIIISNDWYYENFKKYKHLLDLQLSKDEISRKLKQFDK